MIIKLIITNNIIYWFSKLPGCLTLGYALETTYREYARVGAAVRRIHGHHPYTASFEFCAYAILYTLLQVRATT